MTPLHLAALNGKTELVELLITNGAKREAVNSEGKTATDLAALANHANVVLQLVTSNDRPSLSVYASVGDLEHVEELLAKTDIDVNEPDQDNNTPLLLAARNGHTEVVKALLINHAQVNHTNKDKASALQYAVESGDAELVKLLIAGGADVNLRNGIDQGLLHLAPSHSIAEVLIAVGADTNLKDAEGMSPLHHATIRGDLPFVHLLVEFDADVNQVDSGGVTPLHLASQYDHHELASYLLEQNADPNLATHEGNTPLHACSKSRNHPRRVAPLLIKAGADVNRKNKSGKTPLDLEEEVIQQYVGIGLDEAFLKRVHETANLYIKHGGKNGKAIRD